MGLIIDEIRTKLDGWSHGLGGREDGWRVDGGWRMVDGGDGYGQARRGAVLLSDYLPDLHTSCL